jgi:hypothetical protein
MTTLYAFDAATGETAAIHDRRPRTAPVFATARELLAASNDRPSTPRPPAPSLVKDAVE